METWLVTAYCLGVACGALDHGITTSGARARVGYTAACPPELPFGTALIINGHRWICEDRGSAIQGKRVDLFLSDRKAALRFGARDCACGVLGFRRGRNRGARAKALLG